jgi:hypothetical protein
MLSAVPDDSRLTLRDGLAWRRVDERIVVLDERAAVYLAVNQTGAVLWPLLLQGAERTQLEAVLGEKFGVDTETARADVEAFVGTLREKQLLRD